MPNNLLQPGFLTTLGAWLSAILAVVWPGHETITKAIVTAAIVLATAIITFAHVHGKARIQAAKPGAPAAARALEARLEQRLAERQAAAVAPPAPVSGA